MSKPSSSSPNIPSFLQFKPFYILQAFLIEFLIVKVDFSRIWKLPSKILEMISEAQWVIFPGYISGLCEDLISLQSNSIVDKKLQIEFHSTSEEESYSFTNFYLFIFMKEHFYKNYILLYQVIFSQEVDQACIWIQMVHSSMQKFKRNLPIERLIIQTFFDSMVVSVVIFKKHFSPLIS